MPVSMTETYDERRLMAAAASGSPDALGQLFDRYSSEVYRLAYRLLGTREDAEDTVQDVFVGLPRALSRYEESGSFASWLKKVTVRTALIRLRASRRKDQRELKLALTDVRQADDTLRITLDDAFSTLSPGLREVAVLRLVAGYTHEEIAQLLEIAVGASKVRLHRAIKHLQTVLRGSL
jgi:RNA polymerase sigma-70 factor, ECF subfamily